MRSQLDLHLAGGTRLGESAIRVGAELYDRPLEFSQCHNNNLWIHAAFFFAGDCPTGFHCSGTISRNLTLLCFPHSSESSYGLVYILPGRKSSHNFARSRTVQSSIRLSVSAVGICNSIARSLLIFTVALLEGYRWTVAVRIKNADRKSI